MSYRDEPRTLDSTGFGIGKLLPVLLIATFCISEALASEICGPDNLSSGIIKSLSPEGDLTLEEGPVLRLAGLHLPENIDLTPLKTGQTIAYGLLTDTKDRWSRHAAVVFAMPTDGQPVWVQQKLVSEGKALIKPEANLGACWGLLKTAEALARPRILPSPVEAGRFARIEGRVSRLGEGRSVWFVNVFDRSGQRITGVVQKRHLRRMKDGGVDVNALQGQTVRLRGVRSIRNTGVIQLTSADQIEIVR
ncbi:MAG: hypothetical protein ACRCWF_03885 [Beijerinckiaceae bacterium]